MELPTLYIGNKNYSSWSLRPWLALRWAGLPFVEQVIPLGGEGYGRSEIPAIRAISPSGRVPALHVDGVVIYDSLAIAAWAGEREPRLWPENPATRARAWSAVAEMHSGFAAVRRDLSMNIRRRTQVSRSALPADTRADLDRLDHLLGGLRREFGGPWLFGARSIADAFYAPIATRLRTYGVAREAEVDAWMSTVFADSDFRAWEAAAEGEIWALSQTDELFGAEELLGGSSEG
jgi:glutathione S-transferase